MCGSMADIQYETAENRRGKKTEEEEKPQDENIMACPIPYGSYKQPQRNKD